MPVIALSAQNVDTNHELPSLLRAEKPEPLSFSPPSQTEMDNMTKGNLESGLGSQHQHHPSHITPISPIPESPQDPMTTATSSSAARPIPPPPTPRRHRSGILMSRVRAHTGGNTFKSSSKSFGDLSESALGMSDMTSPEAGPSTGTAAWSPSKRTVSAGAQTQRDQEEEGDSWDNSARFYHRMHSRSASRAASRATSPAQSPPIISQTLPGQTPGSPIFVRRTMTMPHGLAPNGGLHSTSLSPNHQFLQQHLPPTFPHSGTGSHSPETTLSEPPLHSMVILTPTTQEWRELKGMESGDVEADDIPSSESSDDEAGKLHRTVSMGSEDMPSSSSSLRSSRPALYQTKSIDFLEKESRHTPDPGSTVETPSIEASTSQPVFTSNVIAPSPSGQPKQDGEVPDMLSFKPRSKRRSFLASDEEVPDLATDEEGDSSPTTDDSPARFASIGRRDSLRVTRTLGNSEAPRTKSKRELERERLFKMVDEELEDVDADRSGSYSVREISRGGGLGTTPTREEKEPVKQQSTPVLATEKRRSPSTSPTSKTFPPPPRKISLSPTQPLRPSPLHASPLNAPDGLPTVTTPSPAESPSIDDTEQAPSLPVPERPILPAPENTEEKIHTMRDYARALQSHHSQSLHRETSTVPDPKGSSSPTQRHSPRSPRVRDTTRQSLVAGRIVQPYQPTPSMALPERPGMFRQASSLQSFSPFRSPQQSASKGGLMPHLSRLDSTISVAPSTGVPSECGTPNSETAGGMGGHGIQDYVILQEAGKGAYGLVMRAKVKGAKGEPIGDEVIIKYIIKARILADCWKKHKKLGPIPVELHVMDQLRHLMYNPPSKPHPWDPSRADLNTTATATNIASVSMQGNDSEERKVETGTDGLVAPTRGKSGDSTSSTSTDGVLSASMEKNLSYELAMVLNRGHPNIVKLLDFFEDREFYYLVMPRYGTGLDLFDRIERSPNGLQSFEIRSLLGQLSDAVRFLHANGIVHRDIKDENVILDGQGRCQLIDFGSAAHWRPGKKWDTFSGTMHYASPEIVRGELYGGKEQDVYALGVVAYVLLIGEPPFAVLPDEALAGLTPDGPASEALAKRCDEQPDLGREADGGGRLGDVADLVRQCMQFDLADRPTAEIMCSHRYLVGEGGWTGYKGWLST